MGSNRIANFDDLSVLSQLPLLRQLTLKGCPVADLPNYLEKILQLVPHLQILDNKRIEGARGGNRKPREEKAPSKKWQPLTGANAMPAGEGREQQKQKWKGVDKGVEVAPRKEKQEVLLKERESQIKDPKETAKSVLLFDGPKMKKQKKDQAKSRIDRSSERQPAVRAVGDIPAPARATTKANNANTNNDDDDDVLDSSALLAGIKVRKGKKNTPGGGAGLDVSDAKRTGVVKMEIAQSSKNKISQQKKISKKKKGAELEKPKESKVRGAAALHAVLRAPEVTGGGSGVSSALASWD